MARTTRRLPRTRTVLAIALLLATGISVSSVVRQAEAADDIDLLRVDGGTPFVMVLVDTSASMNLKPPTSQQGNTKDDFGDLLPAGADDPESKLFIVKQALYEVLSQVENVNFGFAAFNKDELRARSKHWVYTPLANGDFSPTFTYPTTPEAGTDGELSTRELLVSQWVFGSHFNGGVSHGVAGSCESPIDFDQDNGDIKLNRFPKLGVAGLSTTTLWIEHLGVRYRLLVQPFSGDAFTDGSGRTFTNGGLGADTLVVSLELTPVVTCGSVDSSLTSTRTVPFQRVTDFLMVEADVASNASKGNDPGVDGEPAVIGPETDFGDLCTENETVAGFWNFQDLVATNTCGPAEGEKGPFTGRGWESNNDSLGAREGHPIRDPFPVGSQTSLLQRTIIHSEFPELDFGDFIPPNWNVDYRDEFLKRLNPRHPDYDPGNPRDYFGVARFFRDRPSSSGLLELRSEDEKPLVAYGNSPLGRAVNDFRCFVMGANSETGQGKCGNTKTGEDGPPYPLGWDALFREEDRWYQCRVPYFIVITDGEENSNGENPTADVSDFGSTGFQTFVFTFNDSPNLKSVFNFQSTDGEVILVESKGDLKTELERVIGTIEQDARTFATAAVPSVQAAVESKIYLTNFLPLNNTGVWEGHLHAFFRPITSSPPSSDDPNHIWDAAVEMLAQSSRPADDGDNSGVDLKIGNSAAERRVHYARERIPGDQNVGSWSANRELFVRTTAQTSEGKASEREIDFWEGLDIPFDENDLDSVRRARNRGNRIVEDTLLQKESPVPDDSTTPHLPWYILGEIFHSNPLVVGSPVNTAYFVADAEESLDGDGNPKGTGYREFFARHENRRQVIYAGANDGMLHAWDAGRPGLIQRPDPFVPDVIRQEVEFDDGTGRELFAYMPRSILPTVKAIAENPRAHRWGVDGTPAAADVFIDPRHSGTPSEGEREWRTVLIGGLREGGSGYYALDITQPDRLDESFVGPIGSEEAQRDILIPLDTGVVPECSAASGSGGLGCDEDLPYPATLWEFDDSVWDATAVPPSFVKLDEEDTDGNGTSDGNGFPDLGETWSEPNIGRIRIQDGDDVVNRYVAVFGGGLDPLKAGSRGNWIYIVDVETGQTLYKRRLEGSAVSDPAAVDTDQDSFFDRIYVGTTAGFLYRIDLEAKDSSGNQVFPALAPEPVTGVNGRTYTVSRIEKGTDATDPLWAPVKIFDTGGRPLYFPPAVLFVADLGEFAVAFGTGERDDLSSIVEGNGRFYLFVDETHLIEDSELPMTETRFERIDRDEGDNSDLLTDPSLTTGSRGWFLTLQEDERLIGNPFGFSGITFFSTFVPRVQNDGCDLGESSCNTGPVCSLSGDSFIYLVGTTDADAFLADSTSTTGTSRYFQIEGQFVTSPFTEQAVTRSSGSGTGGGEGEGGEDDGPVADELTDTERELVEKLKGLFPTRCKFGNHRIDVKVIQANTEIQRVAAVPICIIEKNWKEITQ